MDRSDRKKRTDKTDQIKRKADQLRAFTEARKEEIAHAGPGAAEMGAHVASSVLEAAGKAAGIAAGLELAGAALMAGGMVYEYTKTWSQLEKNNARAWTSTTIYFGANIIGRDARIPTNSHIAEGKPYTVGEIKERTNRTYGDWQPPWLKTSEDMIDHKKKEQAKERGFRVLADAANKVISQCKTPEARQAGLSALQTNLQAEREKRAAELRRQGNQPVVAQ